MSQKFIEEKPSFKDTHNLAVLAETVIDRISALIEGHDTPNRASDLIAAVNELNEETKKLCIVEEDDESDDIWG